MLSFGIGAILGAIIGAILIEYYSVFYSIAFSGLMALFATIGSFLLPDSVETNEFAVDTDLFDSSEQSSKVVLKEKLKLIFESLKDPLNKKFYAFLIL